MGGWENYFVGELGASAALTGLVLVSISVNLAKIIKHSSLPNLALEALISLVFVIFISTFMLIPGQSLLARSLECLGNGIGALLIVGRIQLINFRNTPREFRLDSIRNMLFFQLSALCCIVAGFFFYFFGISGYYLLVGTTLMAYIASFNDIWILTIEINR